MHMRGALGSMRGFSEYPSDAYGDLVEDVLANGPRRGTEPSRRGRASDILFDPGLGFAKNARQSLELLRRLGEFGRAGAEWCGTEPKIFRGRAGSSPPEDRLGGTIGACLVAVTHGPPFFASRRASRATSLAGPSSHPRPGGAAHA